MQSASRRTRAKLLAGPANSLFAVLNEMLRAVDGRVVLLRLPTDDFDWLHDDIDLLLTESQRQQMFQAAFAKCMCGQIYCRIQQSSSAKAQLILWTLDCSRKLTVDLWTSFDQLVNHSQSRIPAECLLNTLLVSQPCGSATGVEHFVGEETHWSQLGETEEIPALRQLPPDIDFCLLIQHFATKRKDLTTVARRKQILRARERLRIWSPAPALECSPPSALRKVADQLLQTTRVTPDIVALTEDYLLRRLTSTPQNRGLPVLARRQRRGLITEFRKSVLRHRPTVAVIGSDGVGKTSVVSTLAIQQSNAVTAVAKKFYRRSLVYQFTSGLMKRLCGIDRGVFDEFVSPVITLCSAAALWAKMILPQNLWSGSRTSAFASGRMASNREFKRPLNTLILDRSIAGFLITGRKSDSPRLVRGAKWIESFLPPVTTVLLTLPYADLAGRKLELTLAGHEIYQRILFDQSLRARPVDLIILASLASQDTTAAVMSKMLQDSEQPIEENMQTTGTGKVAA